MLGTAIVLFLIAAVGGAYMAAHIFRGRTPPAAVAVLHGALAASALLLVAWAYVQGAAGGAGLALALLVLAALGGFFLLSFHVRGKPHPRAVVVVHAVVAVAGVAALLFVWL